jgi:hypothetical protein
MKKIKNIPIECVHIGGIPGLKISAKSRDIFSNGLPLGRACFNWEDGPKIIGCLCMYDIDDNPECFEITKYYTFTTADITRQYSYGFMWWLSRLFN